MKSHSLTITGLAMMALAWSASAYAAGSAATINAMATLSPKAADGKAKQDLLSILQPTAKFSRGNRLHTNVMRMHTIPRGTGMNGLCTMDELNLRYMATAVKVRPEEERRRPMGVSVRHLYRATGRVVAEDDTATAIGGIWSRDCESLRSDKTALWFPAQDDHEAAKAANALVAATDALRSGRLKPEGCDYTLRQEETCAEAIMRMGRVDKIETMGHDCPAGVGRECFELFLDGAMVVTVVASFEKDSVFPEAVVEVGASESAAVD